MTAYYIGIGATCLLAYVFMAAVWFVLTPREWYPSTAERQVAAWFWCTSWIVVLFFAAGRLLPWFERQVNKLRRSKVPRARAHVANRRRG